MAPLSLIVPLLTVRWRHCHTLLAVYRMRQNGEPEYLSSILRRSSRQVRGSIIVENNKRELVRNSFTFRGAEQWNKMPLELRIENKLRKFKLELRKWVVQHVPRFLP